MTFTFRRQPRGRYLLWFLLLPSIVRADICFLLYQNADNLLEASLRENVRKLTNSPLVQDPSVVTWVHHDALNLRPEVKSALGQAPVITSPLENVWTNDGSQLLTDEAQATKYEGTQYLTYRHDLQKMVVTKEVRVEEDSDDPAVLWSFLGTAISDCVKKQGSETEIFLVMNSYGAGSAGFGGDVNKPTKEPRRLEDGKETQASELMSNKDIALALQQVLQDVPGAPSLFSVVGFDAHYMQSFDTVDDIKDVSEFVLASEALMPEHGWPYATLSDSSSAKALARQVVDEFISQPQSEDNTHRTPKTLSLVDTDKFYTFLTKFEEYMKVMTGILNAEQDAHFFAHLHRARQKALTYDKDAGSELSAVDLGSFVEMLQSMCDPSPDSELYVTMNEAHQFYRNIFVKLEFGPGTEVGTGMSITLPEITQYQKSQSYWDNHLFLDDETANKDSPNYLSFVRAFATMKEPKDLGPEFPSVCQSLAEPVKYGVGQRGPGTTDNIGSAPGQDGNGNGRYSLWNGQGELLLDPHIVTMDPLVVETDLAMAATSVEAKYGIDVTNLLPSTEDNGTNDRYLRRAQEIHEDFMIVYGGEAPGHYQEQNGSNSYTATWDQQFYVFRIGNAENGTLQFLPLYVKEPEDESAHKVVELFFFDDFNTKIRENPFIKPTATMDEAKYGYGAKPAYMHFQTDEGTGETSLTLYVEECVMKFWGLDCYITGKTHGFITPLIPVHGRVNGEEKSILIGGYTGQIVEWSDNVELTIASIPASMLKEQIKAAGVVLELEAKSFDEAKRDIYTFDLSSGFKSIQSGEFPNELSSNISGSSDLCDVARCKPAIQSSTIRDYVASNALMGDSVLSHTDCEDAPWWVVDLLFPRAVSFVQVTNRQDNCCKWRLDGLLVELLDEFDNPVVTVQHDPHVEGVIDVWRAMFSNESARKVRLSVQHEDRGCKYLNLAMVEVYSHGTNKDSCGDGMDGLVCSYGDVALCKPASQSSVLGGEEPAHATDNSVTLAHTKCEKTPWWEADLIRDYVVSFVAIQNRQDCCWERLNGVVVELFDASERLLSTFAHDPEIHGLIQPQIIIPFDDVGGVRYVKLSVDNSAKGCDYLNLAEVLVFSNCDIGDTCGNGFNDDGSCHLSMIL